MANGKSKRKRNSNPRNTTRIRRAINRIEYGTRITPSVDPPNYATVPWWSLTLVTTLTTPSSFNYASLHEAILTTVLCDKSLITDVKAKQALNPPQYTKFSFEIRPVTIRVWGLAKQSITLLPYEIVGKGTHSLSPITDNGSGINFSRLGWRYGAAAKIDPNTSEEVLIAAVDGDITEAKRALVYIQVVFRCGGFTAPKSGLQTYNHTTPHMEVTQAPSWSLF